jgi:hypothetical protein
MMVVQVGSMGAAALLSLCWDDRGFSTLAGSGWGPCDKTPVNLLPLLRHIWWKR